MILFIDTTNREELIVQLRKNDELIAERKYGEGRNHAQHLLPEIDVLLKDNDIQLSNLVGIEVNAGPGSFTGTRVGVAVANSLGFALNLPVNGQDAGTVHPIYDREPNISKPKSRK